MYKKIIIPSLVVIGLFFVAFKSMSNKKTTSVTVDTVATVDDTTLNAGEYEPVVVLELFTSQGCSSCPPADVLLDKVKKQYPNKVYALSYHVDYWNYIGWEDPFSKATYSTKQRLYNQKFRSRSNYTPQMVVNGREHFVGSSASKLNAKIATYGKTSAANKVKLTHAAQSNATVDFEYVVDGELDGKELRVVLVLDEKTTAVKRGENRNRTLKNANIVVAEKYLYLDAATGKGSIDIPNIVNPKDKLTLLLVTENEVSDITGAAKRAI